MARASLVGALTVFACGAPHVTAPPRSPGLASPELAIPGDLDVVVRLDVARLREALGPRFRQALERLGTGDAAWVSARVAEADAVWLAFRPGPEGEPMDSVLVLAGKLSVVVPPVSEGWGPAEALGADVRRYLRRGELARAAPAVIYAGRSDWLVVGTSAEIDALERSVERGARDPRLAPVARGVLSFALRPEVAAAALRRPWPAIGSALGRGQRLAGWVDVKGDRVDLEVELQLPEAELARELQSALSPLLGAVELARCQVSAVERATVARCSADLGALVTAAAGAGCGGAAGGVGCTP